MASDQSFQEHDTYFGTDGDSLLKQKWGLSSSTMATESSNGCFECNICLDSAHDPVVTLCGHLYCWPCIYKWLHIQTSSPDSDQQEQNCPVCKANISYTSLIPLYGRGTSSDSKAEKSLSDISIPQRPLPVGTSTMVSSSPNPQFEPNLFQEQNIATASIFNPYGEMVYARIFGSSDPALFAYSYPFVGSGGNPRMRRQEMQLDKSLNRVSVFLFCCFVLCLLLF